MKAIARWLEGLGAQPDVVEFFEPYGSDWPRAWAELPRGDWMLGIAARLTSDVSAVVRAASACARIALREGGPNPDAQRAIELVEEWAASRASSAPLAAEAERLEALADHAESPVTQSVILAAAAACRSASDPTQAVAAATHAVETATSARADEDPMRVAAEIRAASARAARVHLPTQLVRGPFRG